MGRKGDILKKFFSSIWNVICGIGIFALGCFYIYWLIALHTPGNVTHFTIDPRSIHGSTSPCEYVESVNGMRITHVDPNCLNRQEIRQQLYSGEER